MHGEEADQRADLFSFGAVLYEMLTGQRAFPGTTAAAVMAAILKEDPPELADSNHRMPAALRRIVRHCLEKRPEQRFQSARDLAFALGAWTEQTDTGEAAKGSTESALPRTVQHHKQERWRWAALGLLLGALAVGLVFWLLMNRQASSPAESKAVKRMTIKLPDAEPLALPKPDADEGFGRTAITLSPDGTLLVYAGIHDGKSYLFLRKLDQFDAKLIPGTEGAYDPFFSPDGQQVGFFASGKLKKVSLKGGEPAILCETRTPYGGSWGTDNLIVFADSEGVNLSQIPASGGKPQVLFKEKSNPTLYPQFLPDGKAMIFSIMGENPDTHQIAILSLVTGERRVLITGGTNPRYASSNHLIYARADEILVVPFDLTSMQVTGSPVRLLGGVRIEEWAAAQFTLSQEGTFAYVSGGPAYIGRLVWVDRQGISKPLTSPARAYSSLRLSPDGKRMAVEIANDVYVYEVERGIFTRLTVDGINHSPRWVPDGKRITYYRYGGQNQSELAWKAADGSSSEEILITSKSAVGWYPESWSPDGKILVFSEWGTEGADLLALQLGGDLKPQPWLSTKHNEWGAVFSPNGKYVAYVSDESGRYEIYVRPYSSFRGKWQISTNGGSRVAWSPDGKELFYRQGLQLMAVPVQTQPEFQAGTPRQMFVGPYLFTSDCPYDVHPDGQRFIMIEEATKQPPITHLNVVLNWFEELKQRVPVHNK